MGGGLFSRIKPGHTTITDRFCSKLQQDKELHLLKKIDSEMYYMEINNVAAF